METIVIKRDGTEVQFDVRKIKEQLEFACQGTDINPLEIESKLSFGSNKRITTKEIQEQLILITKNMISLEQPDMNLVVGRLLQWQIYREVYKNTKIDRRNVRNHIEYLVRNNYYKKEILQKYDEFELNDLEIDEDVDFEKVYSQVITDYTKYLLKNKKGAIEYPYLMDVANALMLAKDRDEFFDIYFLLNKQYISLATPFQKNLRVPNGNLGSCFIGETEDSLASLTKSWQEIAFISKEGGGIGWYLGKLRPSNTSSKRIRKSKAVTYWAKIINDIIVTVDQSGTRKGAITLALPWWHMDIEDFISIKSTLDGDLRTKCFDIFPQIVVDNWFLQKVKNKEEVYIFNQYDYKQKTGKDITELIGSELYEALEEAQDFVKRKLIDGKKIKASELWKEALKKWIEVGDFYISNVDNLNRDNYLKHSYITKCANLCQESFSLIKPSTKWKIEGNNDGIEYIDDDGIYHSCNLVSINVSKFNLNDKYLNKTVEYAVKLLDRSIDITKVPVKAAENGSKLLRNIGIGILGLADYLAYKKVSYDSKEGRLEAKKLMEKIAYNAYRTSIELAKKYGSYPLFKEAKYEKLFNKYKIESLNGYDWESLRKYIIKYGIRNFLLLAIAPNTTTALRLGVTASVLPPQDKFFYQTTSDMSIPILPPFIKERFWYYKGKFQMSPLYIIEMVTELQEFVDTGVSMEVPINSELVTAKELSDIFIDKFLQNKLKAIYYSLTVDGNNVKCESCSN